MAAGQDNHLSQAVRGLKAPPLDYFRGQAWMCLEHTGIDFEGLIPEFAEFRLDDKNLQYVSTLFVRSLADPLPRFVESFLGPAVNSATYADRARELYFFLLEKRYTQRLNLLYFAFDIFEDTTVLPEEVVNQTPFPHEDGIPGYRYALEPGFTI